MQLSLAHANATPPPRIGKYPITAELGRGTTSTVFLGSDTFANREVAIKLVHSERLQSDEVYRRFRKAFSNEAALAGKLSHPHIVGIYDAVDEDNFSYIVMEYVAGGTLEAYCDVRRLLPIEQIIEIAFKCALALEFAHRHGVIHRDIKPANILVAKGTDIKISDFGSAQMDAIDSTQLTGIGSPAYMSPEQVQEQSLTQQTDIYSLGVVMYQLLTGRLPYTASSRPSLLYQILGSDPKPPSAARGGVPPELDAIVLRALKRELGARYQTWREFIDDLTIAYQHLDLPDAVDSDTEKFNIIKSLSFFRDFSEIEIWETLHITAWKKVDAGEVIIREGGRGECFYILVHGEVEVTRADYALDVLTSGDCFGEMLYFAETSARRTTTITALTGATIVEIRATALQRASDACQVQFNKAFMRILIERLSWANAKLSTGSES
jgi:serine/threonine protein kinase